MRSIVIKPHPIVFDKVERLINVNGMNFEEEFLAKVVSEHLARQKDGRLPTITDAFSIYMNESASAHRPTFVKHATYHFRSFKEFFGDLTLEELKHWHITEYRDYQLQRGLNPTSVRKHNNTLNAMLNVAFKHLDIDRLSPFRGLKIRGEGDIKRPMPIITTQLINQVKECLLRNSTPHKLVALIQLNTGFRLSEPVFARLEDCVLEHDIPHLWIRRNALSDRKTKSSIRAVPLCGVSLDAAKELYKIARTKRSEWFVPHYARDNGNSSCSQIIKKTLKELDFKSHMFRHAIIDRMKARNDIPTRLAESITGHSSGGSDFNTYGTVGYTLEQKRDVILKVLV
ncbi:tyrosine-type recombinase/integrase [Polynucleobacter sp. AP-Reno-20A-A9]|uniref:tyrosine-type recombinase/integrase n=1 Tax=Polynucleobacter sp. AP-Reno-20A-A9 TaxID=2576925 RepID=UPI001C0BBD8E|nr:tyrosine-type recombinase/integrase [Polynucleobacter sp. AP-Reno-20A-A9]MBU3627704.1 tyrosine-type recombinase/integrase [Polynucleobacter sp. AP-Reno-20A-A9]